MRILLMADHWVGWKITQYLRECNENIVGLLVHPPEYQHYSKEIIEASGILPNQIFEVGKNISRDLLKSIKQLNPDIILVVYWRYILPFEFFNIPPKGCINFHAAYLPFNRGKNPNVWPIIEGTPAGVTLHYIDNGIDSGKIIAQTEVKLDIIDTAQTVYEKLLAAFVELFMDTWPKIKAETIVPVPQTTEEGTFHWGKDFHKLDKIDLDRPYAPLELINLLRARTFPPHQAAYFIYEGKKVYVRIQLEYAKDD